MVLQCTSCTCTLCIQLVHCSTMRFGQVVTMIEAQYLPGYPAIMFKKKCTHVYMFACTYIYLVHV